MAAIFSQVDVHGTLKFPVLLPAARPAQRVNDEPVKGLNLFLLVNFISK